MFALRNYLSSTHFFIYRLTNESNVFAEDLEVLRKAIGFGEYGKFDGDLDFYTYETFRNCEFGSTLPIVTVAPPQTTAQQQQVTTTQQPATKQNINTTMSPMTTRTIVLTTKSSTTVAMATTEEFIVGPVKVTTAVPDVAIDSQKRVRRAGNFDCNMFFHMLFSNVCVGGSEMFSFSIVNFTRSTFMTVCLISKINNKQLLDMIESTM